MQPSRCCMSSRLAVEQAGAPGGGFDTVAVYVRQGWFADFAGGRPCTTIVWPWRKLRNRAPHTGVFVAVATLVCAQHIHSAHDDDEC